MEVIDVIHARRSTRAFTDEAIPRPVLEQLLADASNAPSAINQQPWEVHMVLGEERKRLSRHLMRAYKERQITCGPGAKHIIPDKFMQRARDCVQGMTPLTARMGSDFSTYINEGSLNFYEAPAVALVFVDEAFPPERMVDVGSFVAYLVLAAAGRGLASCPIGLVKGYEDEVKDVLNVPESKTLVISVALGKPAPAAINEFRSSRVPVEEFVRWIA